MSSRLVRTSRRRGLNEIGSRERDGDRGGIRNLSGLIPAMVGILAARGDRQKQPTEQGQSSDDRERTGLHGILPICGHSLPDRVSEGRFGRSSCWTIVPGGFLPGSSPVAHRSRGVSRSTVSVIRVIAGHSPARSHAKEIRFNTAVLDPRRRSRRGASRMACGRAEPRRALVTVHRPGAPRRRDGEGNADIACRRPKRWRSYSLWGRSGKGWKYLVRSPVRTLTVRAAAA